MRPRRAVMGQTGFDGDWVFWLAGLIGKRIGLGAGGERRRSVGRLGLTAVGGRVVVVGPVIVFWECDSVDPAFCEAI